MASRSSRSEATRINQFHPSVKKLFEEGWLHPDKPSPAIRSIFKLLKTQDEMGDYRVYEWVPSVLTHQKTLLTAPGNQFGRERRGRRRGRNLRLVLPRDEQGVHPGRYETQG